MAVEIPTLEPRPLWSATPTPLTEEMEIDVESVHRLVDHHIKLGITGLFLLGTCGEGAWMPERLRWQMVREVAACVAGRLKVAIQVTDNSPPRILENIEVARESGGDIAIIGAPFFVHRCTPERLQDLYLEAIRHSPLPVGIYDTGKNGPTFVPPEVMATILAEEKVILLKDSSCDPGRRDAALAARSQRADLRLLNGFEFDCVSYLEAGYDGLLLGGGIFNGYIARQIMAAVATDDIKQARQLQDHMNEMMWATYGGKELTCWLRGLKHLMVKMGIFRTDNLFLDYAVTDECERNINRLLEDDREMLFPWEATGDA